MKDEPILQPTDVTGPAAPRPRRTVAHVEVDGEGVLYDETTNRVHVLDPIATLIWGGLDGHTTLEELSEELSRAFEADVKRVRMDVLDAVRELASQELLTAGPGGGDKAGPQQGEGGGEDDAEPRFLKDPPSP